MGARRLEHSGFGIQQLRNCFESGLYGADVSGGIDCVFMLVLDPVPDPLGVELLPPMGLVVLLAGCPIAPVLPPPMVCMSESGS